MKIDFAVWALALACLAAPAQAAPNPPPCADSDARKAAAKGDYARYVDASARTRDGYSTYSYTRPESIHFVTLNLVIEPDGRGVLSGDVPKPVALDAEALKPFLTAVAGADLPSEKYDVIKTTPNPAGICTDGGLSFFTVVAHGRKTTVEGEPCGALFTKAQIAANLLEGLARTHGGIDPSAQYACSRTPLRAISGDTIRLEGLPQTPR